LVVFLELYRNRISHHCGTKRKSFVLAGRQILNMKAIIPVAGAGTKLRPHTYTQPKALIPLAGKTILSIIVDQLLEGGISEFIFIVGYLGTKIQDYVLDKYPHLKTSFVFQNERRGIGHAILQTRELVANDEIFIVLGDTICEYDVKPILDKPVSMLGVKRVDDPRDFGVAEIEEDGIISRVVEKPQIPKSNMALVGIYKIRGFPAWKIISVTSLRVMENTI
jgi:glucose-1-phosphate thymidylyltransferase